MATLLKRKYISKNNQEQLFQVFYDNFRSDKDSFLWHRFIDEDDNDVESGTNLEEESVGEDTDTALQSIVDGAGWYWQWSTHWSPHWWSYCREWRSWW